MNILHLFIFTGFTGGDCSLIEGQPPSVDSLQQKGLCDIRQRPCRQTRVYARGILDGSVVCRATGVQVTSTCLH